MGVGNIDIDFHFKIAMKKFAGIVTIVALLAFVSNVYACGEEKNSSKASFNCSYAKTTSYHAESCSKTVKASIADSENEKADVKTANVINTNSNACCPKATKASVTKDDMADTKNSVYESSEKKSKDRRPSISSIYEGPEVLTK